MQTEFVGKNSVTQLSKILKKSKAKKIFLITGKKSYEKSGAKETIDKQLRFIQVFKFSDLKPNPHIEEIKKGIDFFKKFDPDIVITVGGGSIIDAAKAINILSSQALEPEKYITQKVKIKKGGKPLIAIPTTSGSGSEATRFAVVYIGKTKYSLDDPMLLPDYAIVDPQFTYHLPKSITAVSGMDAFSQAIESYWSIKSTTLSKRYAEEAIKIILKNILLSVNSSRRARDAMSKAAHLAGKAINISQTTACHSISYPMTSYFGIPHGQAVALTLGKLLSYNSKITKEDINDGRGVTYVKKTIDELIKLLGVSSAKEGEEKIENIIKKIKLKTHLNSLGLHKDDLDTIVKNGFNPARMRNNPRLVTKDDLRLILQSIY